MIQRELMMAGYLLVVVLFGQCALLGCSMQKSTPKLEKAQSEEGDLFALQKRAEQREAGRAFHPVRIDYLTPPEKVTSPHIFVYKENRRMYVLQSNVLVRDYPVGLGLNPIGDREHDGDGRTPEGDFYISGKNFKTYLEELEGSNNLCETGAGEESVDNSVSLDQRRSIVIVLDTRDSPSSTLSHGEKILIRAGGAHKDWTQGCIALYDSDMEELFGFVSPGTPVTIRP